jgi:hypothetical protein
MVGNRSAYFRTKAAAPWCHLICFSFRVPTNPGRDNVLPPRRTYWAKRFAVQPGLGRVFRPVAHAGFTPSPALWNAAVGMDKGPFPPGYSSSATLLIWNFAGILSW